MESIEKIYGEHQFNKFNRFIAEPKKLVLFAAGELGKKFVFGLNNIGIKVDYFCDNDMRKWGKYFLNVEVISPNQLLEIKNEVKILITSEYYYEILQQLEDLGIDNVFIYDHKIFRNSDFFLRFDFNVRCCQSVLRERENYRKVYNLFEDEKSKDVLLNIMKYRLDYNIEHLKKIAEPKHDYFSYEFFKYNEEEVFIDAGACKGETIFDFIYWTQNKFKFIHAFEPDEINFRVLQKQTNYLVLKNRLKLSLAGIGDLNEKLSFSSNGNGTSNFNLNGSKEVDVYNLDTYLKGSPVTLIKMDIEGFEIKALKGARETIKKYKPKLAICVYHLPDDIWAIPMFLKELVPEYKLYLRHENPNMPYETICYATI